MKRLLFVGMVCACMLVLASAGWAQNAAPVTAAPEKAAPATPAQKVVEGSVQAGPARHPMVEMLKKADKDGDGKVSFDEMKVLRPEITKERFAMMDRNKDGSLTAVDFPSPAERFKDADKNADAKLSFEEFKAMRPNATQERFDAVDKNKDGFLTMEELTTMGPRPGGLGAHGPHPGARVGQAPAPAEPEKK